MSSDPSRLIAALARDRINLDLKTLDLCFLAGIYLWVDRATSRCRISMPGASNSLCLFGIAHSGFSTVRHTV